MRRSPTRSPLLLLATLLGGDLLVFVVFATLGVQTHDEEDAVLTVVRAGAPFALSWFVVGTLLGVYRRGLWSNARRTLLFVPLAWAASDAVALIGRSMWLGNAIVPSFALVTFAFVAGLMTLWRAAFALTLGRVDARTTIEKT